MHRKMSATFSFWQTLADVFEPTNAFTPLLCSPACSNMSFATFFRKFFQKQPAATSLYTCRMMGDIMIDAYSPSALLGPVKTPKLVYDAEHALRNLTCLTPLRPEQHTPQGTRQLCCSSTSTQMINTLLNIKDTGMI